jgi:vancomycin resistance protein YoaR
MASIPVLQTPTAPGDRPAETAGHTPPASERAVAPLPVAPPDDARTDADAPATTWTRAALRRSTPTDDRLRRGLSRLGWRLARGGAVAILLLVGGLLAMRAAYGDRIYPAVYVGDMDLGGMTRDEARAALEKRAATLEQGLVTFTYEGRSWTPTLAEIGVRADVEGALDTAYAVGREDQARDRLLATSLLIRDDHRLPLVLTLDQTALDAWFDQIAAELGLLPHDAELVVEGATVRIEPEVSGTGIDRVRASELIRAALAGLEPTEIELPVGPWIAKVVAGDLEGAKAQVEQALSQPVKVTFDGQTWTIKPADFGQFVVQRIDPDPMRRGADAVIVEVDEAGLASWLDDTFAGEIDRDAVNAEVGWNGERVVAVAEHVDGYRLRPRSFARDLAASFLGDHAQVAIAVSVIQPPVRSDNLDTLGITTMLARGDSNYDGGNWERRHNVQVGTSLLNGTLVAPGEEFSFNHAIGEITEDKGYVESSVVVAERVGRDVGGGICQVSTTVFRAALLAGLPIMEWWPHTYEILQYEIEGWGPGYDASILQPEGDPFGGGDFKFLNPTNSWLLVESWTTEAYVIVNIYGPDLGYRVEFSDTTKSDPIVEGENLEIVNEDLPPGTIKQTEYTLVGFEVSFVRYVYDRDGILIEEHEFYTRFKGRGNVYQVSPDMVGQSPASY